MNQWPGIVALVAVALCGGCNGCKKPTASVTAPATGTLPAPFLPTQEQSKLRTMKLWLGTAEIDAELALTLQEQATGMMFRTNRLAENTGMLFPLPYTQRASFWMLNCPLPLSAAYIDPDGVIQEIHVLEANNTNSVAARSENIRFVLEEPEGWFQRHNISTGAVVRTSSGSLMDTFFPGR